VPPAGCPELAFGEVPLNQQSVLDLTLNNNGTDILIIDSLNITGQHPDSIVFELINTDLPLPKMLEPDSSLVLQIGYTPQVAGLSYAQLVINSDDPFNQDTPVSLTGTGIAGSLILSTTRLNFGDVPLNSQSILYLTISNGGEDLLYFDSLNIIDQHPDSILFEYINPVTDFPLILQPDSNLIVPIGFSPIDTVATNAKFLIRSRDATREREEVLLTGTGIAAKIDFSARAVDFGQVALDSDSSISIYIGNTGRAELQIPFDSISVTGSHANAYSLANIVEDMTIQPNDSALMQIVFQPVLVGTNQADIRMRSNDPINPVSVIRLSGFGYDASPVSVTFDQTLSSNPFTRGQTATIGFIISGSQSIESADVYVRSGGGKTYNKLSLVQQSGDSWAAQIHGALVTERGVEYYVEVSHGTMLSLYPINGNDMPNAIQVTVPSIQFPWHQLQTNDQQHDAGIRQWEKCHWPTRQDD